MFISQARPVAVAVLLLCSLAPLPASAEENLAVRGGWFYEPWDYGYFRLGLGGLSDGLYVPPVPRSGVVAAVEYRLSGDTWLVLQMGGAYIESDTDTSAGGHNGRATLGAGVRQYVWSAGPVAFSLLGTLGGDYYDSLQTYTSRYRLQGMGFTAQAGFAVDLELTEQLALHFATPVVRGRWSRMTVRDPEIERTDIEVVATLEPQLGLRLAF